MHLEMYFGALGNNNETKEEKLNTKEFLEQQLEQFMEEIWKKLIHILVSNRVAG